MRRNVKSLRQDEVVIAELTVSKEKMIQERHQNNGIANVKAVGIPVEKVDKQSGRLLFFFESLQVHQLVRQQQVSRGTAAPLERVLRRLCGKMDQHGEYF